jgi:hypothetical protein
MPLYPPPAPVSSATPVGTMGLLATTPTAVTTGYTWTYATQAKAFPAYISNPQGAAYVGGLLDLLQAARLTDLNAVRVAMENLRVFTENLAQQHNAISIALRDAGLISN